MKTNFRTGLLLICAVLFASAAQALSVDELLPDERNNVEIFDKFSPRVVHVHRLTDLTHQRGVRTGSGSGIIWDDKGHIVTNYHVIRGAEHLAISIGKLTVTARVVGVEPRKDIAVLVINSPKALALLKSYKPFELVYTRSLLTGQKVLAIGNPFGLDHSLTVGIISALGREVPGIGGVTIRDMIQTDASINPGNSGGPLLDSKGRLIGLNTLIYTNSGSSAGVGFAVPSEDIARIVSQIITKGRVVLAGIGIKQFGRGMEKQLGVDKGILIASVLPRTPAEAAGLRGTRKDYRGRIILGDVLVAINGHPVDNYDMLYNLLSHMNINENITITVLRGGKRMNFKMKTIDIAGY